MRFGGNLAHKLTHWIAQLGLAIGPVMTKKIRRRTYLVIGRLLRPCRDVASRHPADDPGPARSPQP